MPTDIDGATNGKFFPLATMSLESTDLDLLGPENKVSNITKGLGADRHRLAVCRGDGDGAKAQMGQNILRLPSASLF